MRKGLARGAAGDFGATGPSTAQILAKARLLPPESATDAGERCTGRPHSTLPARGTCAGSSTGPSTALGCIRSLSKRARKRPAHSPRATESDDVVPFEERRGEILTTDAINEWSTSPSLKRCSEPPGRCRFRARTPCPLLRRRSQKGASRSSRWPEALPRRGDVQSVPGLRRPLRCCATHTDVVAARLPNRDIEPF